MDTNDSAVSGSYFYGVQGKLVGGSGSFSGSNMPYAAIYGQLDVTGTTCTSGKICGLYSMINGVATGTYASVDGIWIESNGAGNMNSFIKMYGFSTYIFEMPNCASVAASTTGTPGAVTGATGWLRIKVNGAVRYIALADSVT